MNQTNLQSKGASEGFPNEILTFSLRIYFIYYIKGNINII